MKGLVCLLVLLWTGLATLVANVSVASALTVTASGYQSPHKPENVMDGSLDTRWSCQGECWLQFDYGHVWEFQNDFWINGHNQSKRTAVFDIAVSVDGITWETVFSGTSTGDSDWGDGWEVY